MKKISWFILPAILIIAFAGCDNGNVYGEQFTPTTPTTMTIQNESSTSINMVFWNNMAFWGWDWSAGMWSSLMLPGQSSTNYVDSGVGFIRFNLLGPGWAGYTDLRTSDVVSVENNEHRTFIFTNNTIVFVESSSVPAMNDLVNTTRPLMDIINANQ